MPPLSELVAKLQALGIPIPSGRLRIDGYGDSPELSQELIDLIRTGSKRAGTGLLWAYEAEAEELPQVGDIEIVVDHNYEPVLLTRVTTVEVVPFNEVTAGYAAIEGEVDGSLDYWREGHWNFFSRECARIGREPRDDMPVVCSVFDLLASVPRSAA
jgi:uncharacterized protein YhfF